MKFMLLYWQDEMAMARLPESEIDRIVAEKTRAAQERLVQGKQVAGQRLWPTREAIEWARKALTFEAATVDVRPVWETCPCHGSFTCSSRV